VENLNYQEVPGKVLELEARLKSARGAVQRLP